MRLRDLSKKVCPICGNEEKWFAYGVPPNAREGAGCDVCASAERHRFIWIYLNSTLRIENNCAGKKILHVAAELCLQYRFRRIPNAEYLTADLMNPAADLKMDITDIQFGDEEFDIIVCNHVLEHVPDDIKAMSEFYRTLKSDGFAIISVPMRGEKTYEDFSITSPEEREKHFGQFDHVRWYGTDFTDRLRSVGFLVEPVTTNKLLTDFEIKKYNLAYGDTFFVCRK